MDAAELTAYITTTFDKVQPLEADGNLFFYYCPTGEIPEKTFPFATLITNDQYDNVSNLGREGVYRINLPMKRSEFIALYGEGEPDAAKYDFTAFDTLLPHPVYASYFWVSVVNPGPATLPKVRELLAYGYRGAVGKAE